MSLILYIHTPNTTYEKYTIYFFMYCKRNAL